MSDESLPTSSVRDSWIAGNPDVAARVDPTLAATLMALLQVVLALGIHTKLGLDTETLFEVVMGVGMLLTIGRRIQAARRAVAHKARPGPDGDV